MPGTPSRHTGSNTSDAEHTGPRKKKRKKLSKGRLNPSSNFREVFRQYSHQTKDNKAIVGDDDDEAATKIAIPVQARHKPAKITIPSAKMFLPCTVPRTPTKQARDSPSEDFVFDSLKDYKIARAIFSTGYSSAGSPLPEDANIKATLRWNQVMAFITSPPISCEVLPMKGVSVKIVRPARNGLEARSCVLHKPHSRNPRCEREVLENFATSFKLAFGWEKDDFVFGTRADLEEQGAEMPDDKDDGDSIDDIDSI